MENKKYCGDCRFRVAIGSTCAIKTEIFESKIYKKVVGKFSPACERYTEKR